MTNSLNNETAINKNIDKDGVELVDSHDVEQWMSVSDLMSGLMLIFLLIAIAFMISISKKSDKLKNISEEYIIKEKNLNQALKVEFTEDELKRWNVEILPSNIVRLKSPDVLFPTGKSDLQPSFKMILSEFFPRYIKVISGDEFKDHIDEVRVEGHTDSRWWNLSPRESYIYNLDLSQARAKSVLNFSINIENIYITDKFYWLKSRFRAVGFSSAKPLDNNGELCSDSNLNEDSERSRRVEFRIITRAHEAIQKMVNSF